MLAHWGCLAQGCVFLRAQLREGGGRAVSKSFLVVQVMVGATGQGRTGCQGRGRGMPCRVGAQTGKAGGRGEAWSQSLRWLPTGRAG